MGVKSITFVYDVRTPLDHANAELKRSMLSLRDRRQAKRVPRQGASLSRRLQDKLQKAAGLSMETNIFSTADDHHKKQLASSQRELEFNFKDQTYLLQPFKSGGISQIYRGVPTKDGVPEIAVKMVQNRWHDNPHVRRQFSIESQIMRELAHPSLPKYLCRGVLSNRSFYAYEFIEGIQLINLCQRPDLFPKTVVSGLALNFVKQLLKALDYLHNQLNPIVHGDISSENILISHHQDVFLLDFGCAHYLNMHGFNAKKWVGKPSFISPEQARGEAWDQRSDLYQVGILYYELIAGKRWNRGTSKESKHRFAATVKSPKLDFLADHVPIPVSMILSKMLSSNPNQRFQSAAEVLDALGSIRRFTTQGTGSGQAARSNTPAKPEKNAH